MNYKLAKQLKDAGFPQIGEGQFYLLPDRRINTAELVVEGMFGKEDLAYEPTLSELIEAIGATGRTLEMHQYSDKSGWMASVDKHTWTSDKELDVALGHLFLALNKK